MLKVALPRPTSDAVSRGAGRVAFDARPFDDLEEPPARRLTRAEAEDLRRRFPSLSPWRVVAAQAALGLLVAAVGWAASGSGSVTASLLFGAATVVLPGALMARGMTSKLSSASPVASMLSVLAWGSLKVAVSVGMLVLAPRLVANLSWPALLAALVICLQSYWFALLWRGR